MHKEKTDVLIVGSGAGAAPAAFKLTEKGFKVTMLEKGHPWSRDVSPEDEYGELFSERHRPSEIDDPTVVVSNGNRVANASRIGQAFYLLGGGTVRYTATSWRLRPQDFRKKTTYGSVAGATLTDWPLSYADIEPYYTEAEKLIGISGKSGVDPTEPKRSKDWLMPPLKEDTFQKMLVASAKKLGFKPFPIPVAIHSEPSSERGTAPCMQCGWCSGFPCQFMAKSSVDVVVYPRLAPNKSFLLKTDAYATRVVTSPKDKRRVSGVEYIDLKSGKKHFIEARVVILAASAIQTSRLMLLSDNLANSSGLLGKNLMFHLEAKASAVFAGKEFHQAYYKKTGIHDFYFPQKGDDFVNHRSIQSGSKAPPIAFSLSKPGFGKALVESISRDFLRTQELQSMVEDMPQEKNQVTLSKDKKDPWGIPSPQVDHVYHDDDRKAIATTFAKMKALLETAGGTDIKIPEEAPKNISDRYTWHLMGTARMGTDPAVSVVNASSQAHDIDNLFITDGSVFPTSGGLNPTLTIQALSLRTADRIESLMKEGRI